MISSHIMLKDLVFPNTDSNSLTILDFALEHQIMHIPITENGQYLGILSLDILNDIDFQTPRPVLDFADDLLKISIAEGMYLFEAIPLLTDSGFTAIPVVNNENKILGLVRNQDIVRYFANTLSLREYGGFITLKVSPRDYNLQEIARIVESNNAKILSLHIDSVPNEDTMLVTVKINRRILTHILATFTRFEYHFIAYSQQDELDNSINERYQSLLKYLNP